RWNSVKKSLQKLLKAAEVVAAVVAGAVAAPKRAAKATAQKVAAAHLVAMSQQMAATPLLFLLKSALPRHSAAM
ncbi:hypothetical protein, partial [Streptococcus pyogenes]|uniref:hypothetical protein n=1 Tax=Streptococcus pyogenes TaxID=1314 RepID=UPI003DA005C4